MGVWRSLSGMVEVRLISAEPMSALRAVLQAGIEVTDAEQEDDLTLRFGLRRCDYRSLRAIVRKRGERLEVLHRKGLYWALRRLIKRPVLLIGIGFLLFLTVYLPSRVYFVEIEGNVNIPSALIEERAEGCGIGFGAKRRYVRSERMKNALLQAIPELQWAGINTYGCRAVISVRERPALDAKPADKGVCSVVAARDGVIREITVHSGNRLCVPGQAVKKGQVLISGYTDCGICIRATRAEGEVYAQTERSLQTVLPLEYAQKGQITYEEKNYSLIIGKNLINFFKDSGISGTSCDKMYAVNYITLPGGFRLPIGLVTQTVTYYETVSTTMDEVEARRLLSQFSGGYLTGVMTAGQIEAKWESFDCGEGVCVLYGRYACVEMIGKIRPEENLQNYGETD